MHQYDRISTPGLALVPHKSYQINKPNRANDSPRGRALAYCFT